MVEILKIEGKDNKDTITSTKNNTLDKIKNSNKSLVFSAMIKKNTDNKIGIESCVSSYGGTLEENTFMLKEINKNIEKFTKDLIKQCLNDDSMNCSTCDKYNNCDKPYKKERGN